MRVPAVRPHVPIPAHCWGTQTQRQHQVLCPGAESLSTLKQGYYSLANPCRGILISGLMVLSGLSPRRVDAWVSASQKCPKDQEWLPRRMLTFFSTDKAQASVIIDSSIWQIMPLSTG